MNFKIRNIKISNIEYKFNINNLYFNKIIMKNNQKLKIIEKVLRLDSAEQNEVIELLNSFEKVDHINNKKTYWDIIKYKIFSIQSNYQIRKYVEFAINNKNINRVCFMNKFPDTTQWDWLCFISMWNVLSEDRKERLLAYLNWVI